MMQVNDRPLFYRLLSRATASKGASSWGRGGVGVRGREGVMKVVVVVVAVEIEAGRSEISSKAKRSHDKHSS